ncbi:cathepsin S, ortholog 1 isoform X2 [Corythoichthys intestinalis]|uniref:cathepsin S, ortholog 1 isoform X2 n=1 Tax=Corythoichthys intestinalis TaxID=161448 RepID=UPI0025A5036D|nr:cathepsin S, ortholog 1 isoform X2 [Corythoichthys intestinalis]
MHISCTILLLSLFVHVHSSNLDHDWLKWTLQHGKIYPNQTEAAFRRAVWDRNVRMVLEHNREVLRGRRNFTLGLNHLADMTSEEVNQKLNGLKVDEVAWVTNYTRKVTLPRSLDWRTNGLVGPVQDQTSEEVNQKLNGLKVDEVARVTNYTRKVTLPRSLDWRTKGLVGPVQDQERQIFTPPPKKSLLIPEPPLTKNKLLNKFCFEICTFFLSLKTPEKVNQKLYSLKVDEVARVTNYMKKTSEEVNQNLNGLKMDEVARVTNYTRKMTLPRSSDWRTKGLVGPIQNQISEEGNQKLNIFKVDEVARDTNYSKVTLPRSLDWRTKGLVSPVQDQGICGSCWAFSSLGALEGQMKKRTGNLVPLSPQNLLDCSSVDGNHGCRGGYITKAYRYVIRNRGVDSERFYPYERQSGKCRYSPKGKAGYCSNFRVLPGGDERALKATLADVGPLAVAVNAMLPSFHLYRGGIYDDPDCEAKFINHAVLLVGYGSDRGREFWLLKNSWGSAWGEDGFIRISRNRNNVCGVANFAVYPQL